MKTSIVALIVLASFSGGASCRESMNAQELFREVSGSIVTVSGQSSSGNEMRGSGVLIAKERVVTNCHVVGAGFNSSVHHMGQKLVASLVASNVERDLCLLRVPAIQAMPMRLGANSSTEVGQTVFTVGSPQGLSNTIAQGIISGLRRIDDANLIQTTAPISQGSSGGGLFNADGELIGITTLYLDSGQQLNFAVPIEWVRELLVDRPKRSATPKSEEKHTRISNQDASDAARAATEAQASADAAAAAAAADAAADERDRREAPWVEVASSDKSVVSLRKGSFELSENKGGEIVALALAQITNTLTGKVTFQKLYVAAQDCSRGYGEVVTLDLDGEFVASTKYVLGGDSVGSGVADTLCALHQAAR